MASPYVGEIRMFAGNFAPLGWAFCDGALMPISENETLFNLIGTTYGGDGQSTFALPDLRGRSPVHMGTNPSTGTNYALAETGGTENVTLSSQQIPSHDHVLVASTDIPTLSDPAGAVTGGSARKIYHPYPPTTPVTMNAGALASSGGSQPHENRQPFLGINFIISLNGLFPSPT